LGGGLFRQRLSSELDTRSGRPQQQWRHEGLPAHRKGRGARRYASSWYYDDEDPIIEDRARSAGNLPLADANGNRSPTPRPRSRSFQAYDDTHRSSGDNRPWCAPRAARTPKIFWTEPERLGERFLIRSASCTPRACARTRAIDCRSRKTTDPASITLIYVRVPARSYWLVLGWFMAGAPYASAGGGADAHGSPVPNLSLRIPTASRDELDYLILTFNPHIERLESSSRDESSLRRRLHELRTPITASAAAEVACSPPRPPTSTASHVQRAFRISTASPRLCGPCCYSRRPSRVKLVLQKSRLNWAMVEDCGAVQIPAEAAEFADRRCCPDAPPG